MDRSLGTTELLKNISEFRKEQEDGKVEQTQKEKDKSESPVVDLTDTSEEDKASEAVAGKNLGTISKNPRGLPEFTSKQLRDMGDGGMADALKTSKEFKMPQTSRNPLSGNEFTSINAEVEAEAEKGLPGIFTDVGEMKEAVKARIGELQKEENILIPKGLTGWKMKHFNNVGEYDKYAREIAKVLSANRVLVEDYTRGDDKPEWSTSTVPLPDSDLQVGSDQHQQLDDVDVVGKNKQVAFDHTTYNPGNPQTNDTYAVQGGKIGRTGSSGGPGHSTPYPNKRGQDVSLCSHIGNIGPEEEARYEQYDIPQQFRRREDLNMGNSNEALLSSTMVGTADQGTKTTGVSNINTQQSIMTAISPGHMLDMFTTFSGDESRYLEWKSTTKTLMRNIEADMQAILLKKLLKNPELQLVGHIYHTDQTAVEEIWKSLDEEFGSSLQQAEIHMTNLQNWARNGAQCSDYRSLHHLYNLVQENYYGIVRLGAEHIGMAEAIGYAITPLLFGRSQKEVNRLKVEKGTGSINIKKVLDIMKKHLIDLKSTERDADKFNSNDPDALHKRYSERDLPFLRQSLYTDSSKQHKHGYKGKNYDPNYNYRDKSRDYYDKDRYRDKSRDKSRDYYDKDRYRDKSRDNYYRDKSRDYKDKDQYRDKSRDYYDKDRYIDKSRDKNYKDDKYKYRDDSRNRHGERGRSAEKAQVNQTTTDIDSGKRTRDPTPGPSGRLSSGRSRSRSRSDRLHNTFNCTLCLSDEHDVFECKKYTVEQVYTICNERRYCYVCFMTGHGSANCKSDRHCKNSSKCRKERHNTKLCDRFKKTTA